MWCNITWDGETLLAELVHDVDLHAGDEAVDVRLRDLPENRVLIDLVGAERDRAVAVGELLRGGRRRCCEGECRHDYDH